MSITSNKEDYLKAIYESGGVYGYIPNKLLAERLSVTPASVSEMLSKLKDANLIEYKPYHGSRLTPKGIDASIHIVRSHKLWEVFLIRHLGYSWREAHEEAQILEHVATPRMIDRLNAFLNYPATCPHGSIIPSADNLSPKDAQIPLASLKVGDRARLMRITEDAELFDYLANLKLAIGEELAILDMLPYEGGITVSQGGKAISVSHKAGKEIFVELIS